VSDLSGAIRRTKFALDMGMHGPKMDADLRALLTEIEHSERVIVGLNKQLTEQFELSSKFAAELTAAREALTWIAENDQSGPMLFVDDGKGRSVPWRNGGGEIAARARAALRSGEKSDG
jgi:hypothetical protein